MPIFVQDNPYENGHREQNGLERRRRSRSPIVDEPYPCEQNEKRRMNVDIDPCDPRDPP